MDVHDGTVALILNNADYIIVGLIGISILVSLIRGFVREALALLTWVVAIWSSMHLGHRFSVFLAPHITTPSLRMLVSYTILFFGVMIAGTIVSKFLVGFIKKSSLSGTDRLMGGMFGLLRGTLIVALLVLGAGLTRISEQPAWRNSFFIPHFEVMAQWMAARLPANVGLMQKA